MDGPRLVVHRTLTSESGHLTFRNQTKNGRGRVVSLPAFLANMLTEHTADLAPTDLLFPSPGGPQQKPGPMRHELFVRRVFRPAVKTTLPQAKHNLRFHDLRHTCAALLIAARAHPLAIMTRLGHSSITTTMDRYGWLFPSAEQALAATLDATYNGVENVIPLRPKEDAA